MSAEPNVPAPTNPDPAIPSRDRNEDKMTDATAGSKPAAFALPRDLQSLGGQTDELIVRLNKVLQSPGGLTAFLGTANYALYIIAHAHSVAPSRAEVIATLSRIIGRTPSRVGQAALKPSGQAAAIPSPITNLALAVADTRTTLRLTGLIPFYCLLRGLLRQQKDPNRDSILHGIAVAQVLAYMGFQSLENIYCLTNKGVISANISNRLTGGNPAKVMTYACRSWITAITLDFVRLLRESQLHSARMASGEKLSVEEQKQRDEKWWSDLFVSMSWYPMALQYAVDGGIGLNMGMVGLCGFFAYFGRFRTAWAASAK